MGLNWAMREEGGRESERGEREGRGERPSGPRQDSRTTSQESEWLKWLDHIGIRSWGIGREAVPELERLRVGSQVRSAGVGAATGIE